MFCDLSRLVLWNGLALRGQFCGRGEVRSMERLYCEVFVLWDTTVFVIKIFRLDVLDRPDVSIYSRTCVIRLRLIRQSRNPPLYFSSQKTIGLCSFHTPLIHVIRQLFRGPLRWCNTSVYEIYCITLVKQKSLNEYRDFDLVINLTMKFRNLLEVYVINNALKSGYRNINRKAIKLKGQVFHVSDFFVSWF